MIQRLLITASVCTLMVFLLSTSVCRKYYERNHFGPDPVDGLLHNIDAFQDVREVGRWQAAINQFASNPTTPFTSVMVLLVSPNLFLQLSGHLLVSLPFFFIFLFLWGYYLHKRNFSGPLISSLLFAYASTWIVYGPYSGIAFYLPDNIASYPLAIGGVSLLLWRNDKKYIWLIVFSVSISISVLTRYIFSVYSFALYGPLFAWLFFESHKRGGSLKSEIINPALLVGTIIFMLCGIFIIKNYSHNFGYYSYWADKTLSLDRWYSVKAFTISFIPFFGRIHWVAISGIISFQIYLMFKQNEKIKYETIGIAVWLLIALPFLWTIVMGTDGLKVKSAFLAAFPITWVGLTSLYHPIERSTIDKKIALPLAILIMLLSSVHVWRSYQKFDDQIKATAVSNLLIKKTTRQFAHELSDNKLIQPNYSLVDLTGMYIGETIAVEYFYRTHNKIDLALNHKIFSTGRQLWAETNYKDMTQREINNDVLQRINDSCSLVLVREPNEILLPEPQGREVVWFVIDKLNNSKEWINHTQQLNGYSLTLFEKVRR